MLRLENARRKTSVCIALALVLLFLPLAAKATALPAKPQDLYVYDQGQVLDAKTTTQLLAMGSALDEQTTAQLVVAIVPSLGGEDIEGYAYRLFRTWGIGAKDKNNGVLLLVSIEDRKARIEVGYGLEGALPDGKVGRILDDSLIPKMRDGNISAGISDTYYALLSEIATEYNVSVEDMMSKANVAYTPSTSSSSNETNSIATTVLVIIAIILISCDLLFNRGRIVTFLLLTSRRRGGGSGGGFGGSSGGGFGGGSSGGGGASRGW